MIRWASRIAEICIIEILLIWTSTSFTSVRLCDSKISTGGFTVISVIECMLIRASTFIISACIIFLHFTRCHTIVCIVEFVSTSTGTSFASLWILLILITNIHAVICVIEIFCKGTRTYSSIIILLI